MFGLLQPEHLLLILLIVLIVFGAGKLPDTMRDLGRGIRSFRDEAENKPQTATAATPSTAATPAMPTSPSGAETKFCPSCGKPVVAGAKFCPECGKQI